MTSPGKDAEDGPLTTADALAQLSFLIQGALLEATADYDISVIQTRLLGILRDRQPTMNELGARLHLDKSSVTGLVDRAERRGLVRRMASSQDRRAVHVSITDVGRTMADEASAKFAERVDALTAGLTPAERARLTTLAGRVLSAGASSRLTTPSPSSETARPSN